MGRLGIQILIQALDVFYGAQKAEGCATLWTIHPNDQIAKGSKLSRRLSHLAAEGVMLVQCEWIHLSEFSIRRLLQS